ncbi:BRO family protein [Roseomonas gilardii]|uniref:BRO-N domain-containing protein n=1 Tax=Roseomonas gilardii TaxID=257708 RepID=UPI001C92D18C
MDLRTVEIEGKPWFVAADVCRCLGLSLYAGATQHLGFLAPEEKQTLTPASLGQTLGRSSVPDFGPTKLSFITESGLYKLIMRSDKPEARTFQGWVTRDVLPAIRKDGAYVMGEKALAAPAEPMHACGAPGSQGRSGPSHSLACTGAHGADGTLCAPSRSLVVTDGDGWRSRMRPPQPARVAFLAPP